MEAVATVAQLAQNVAELQQQIQGLALNDVSNLQATVSQQQQDSAALIAHAQAAPPVAPPASHLKPHKPDPFSSVKTSGRPEAWTFTVETFFDAANIQDPDRVTYVATLLRGPAALWWQSHVRTAAMRISTWSAFQTAFLSQFAPVSNVRHAHDRLSALYQTRSVA